ncbi:hypothetical protein KGM_204106 [Danaus plexippus plexippus]|uniref:Uncharacterized protein n=1 Tax=Danaus plexippus plexippus TaxID=278856 RepID=A0A212EM16_DANPL|nr:hypothetical protein KGM_204106 [Danaus plexippus plexippus]
MTNQTQLMKEISQRAYYDKDNESVERGPGQLADKEWRIQTVIWLMVIALLLWIFSYALVMAITYLYDQGMQVVYAYDFFYIVNESSIHDKNFNNYGCFQ